jgi:hypothetical protein
MEIVATGRPALLTVWAATDGWLLLAGVLPRAEGKTLTDVAAPEPVGEGTASDVRVGGRLA